MPLTTYTAGQVLTANSLNDNFGTTVALVKTQTIGTAVASVTVSDAFSSTYDNYRIIVSGGTASTATNIGLQLGATNTAYYSAGFANLYNNSAYVGANADNANSFTAAAMGTTDNLDAVIDLLGPNLAKTTGFFSVAARHTTGGFQQYTRGYQNSTTQFTAFTLTPASGTLTGGTIRVYGYANS
jgi:hypothetical protein